LKKQLLVICVAILIYVAFIFILDLLISDRPGTADNVQVNVGLSERFTQEEIQSAADLVASSFGFRNSELTYLWYDEDISNLEIERSFLTLDKDSTIILFSTFVVRESSSGGTGFLSPGTIENFGWVLSKDIQSGEWELIALGFSRIHF